MTRRGFAFPELLVIVAIMLLLAGLALVAVQRARETAARLRCANHLKQIGLGMQLHHDLYQVFSSNGGWDGRQKVKDTAGKAVTLTVNEKFLHLTFKYGVGDPQRVDPRDQPGSWAFALLPFVEQTTMYQDRMWTEPVPLYHCPSRRLPLAQKAADDAYGSYVTGGWTWGKTDYAGNARVIQNRPSCMGIAQITDGTTHTILVGEKAMSPENYNTGTWYWDEPYFVGGSGGTVRGFGPISGDGLKVVRDSPDMRFSYQYNWGSPHAAGANMLFADGSVRLLRFDTPRPAVLSLLTPNGGETQPNDL